MILWLIGELIALYFLSRWATQSLFLIIARILRSRTIAITIMLVLQFPGTVIHELAHLFTAEILRVPTGKLTLVPESIREDHIKSGSVAIAETDPFRRYAIGLAPLFAGMLTLTAISFLASQDLPLQGWTQVGVWYLLFAVSNTMFPSPEDTRGIWPFLIALASITTVISMLGFRLSIPDQIVPTLMQVLRVVLLINVLIGGCSAVLRRVLLG